MAAIGFRMMNGIPGSISKPNAPLDIQTQKVNPVAPFPAYGLPGRMVLGALIPVSVAGDGALVHGFVVRPFPTSQFTQTGEIGVSVPPTTGLVGCMVQGYMTVKVNAGVVVPGGPVYVRVASGAANTPVGGIEAAAVANATEQIPGATFFGEADANGFAEIRFSKVSP